MRPPWLDDLAAEMAPWRDQGVVVAVSGGSDSVALLRGLMELRPEGRYRLSVATLDHSTRAGASAADAAFVGELAARLGLPFDLGTWQAPRLSHFEADARRARYAWLLGVAHRRGAAAVAVGHTRDDQAETILHRIIRGTGLAGLAGMEPRRPLGPGVTLVRPILTASRFNLQSYLAVAGQAWRDDPSNLDRDRTRARLRHDLLPHLADDFNPNVAEALVHLGRTAASAASAARRRAARRLRRATVARTAAQIQLDRAILHALAPSDRVDLIRLAWRRLGWPEAKMTHARWHRLAALAGGTEAGRVAVGAGVEAVATEGHWTLRRPRTPRAEPTTAPQPLPVPGSVAWQGGRVVAAGGDLAAMDERVDLDAVIGPLTVRPAAPGDRFDPLGMGGRSQPLAHFFRGRRVGLAERPGVPLVADARGIIWVAGHRIAHRVRRTAATTRILGLRYERAASL